MTTAATMLDAHPARPRIDTQLHGDTVDALVEASRTARQCANACLHDRTGPLTRCVELDLDVADLTAAAANVVIRLADPPAVLAVLAACRAALRACAEECRHHGSHLRHCAVCAEVCGRAEELCLRMEAAVGHLVVAAGGPADSRPGFELPQELPADLPGSLDEVVVTEGRGRRPPIQLVAGGDLGDGAH